MSTQKCLDHEKGKENDETMMEEQATCGSTDLAHRTDEKNEKRRISWSGAGSMCAHEKEPARKKERKEGRKEGRRHFFHFLHFESMSDSD